MATVLRSHRKQEIRNSLEYLWQDSTNFNYPVIPSISYNNLSPTYEELLPNCCCRVNQCPKFVIVDLVFDCYKLSSITVNI